MVIGFFAIMISNRHGCRWRHGKPIKVVCGDVPSSVNVIITHHKFNFQSSNINLVDGPKKIKHHNWHNGFEKHDSKKV